MKIWINFDEKDIKNKRNGWHKGEDFDNQVEFEEFQDIEDCYFEFQDTKVILHFSNGYIEMTRTEFGGLFK